MTKTIRAVEHPKAGALGILVSRQEEFVEGIRVAHQSIHQSKTGGGCDSISCVSYLLVLLFVHPIPSIRHTGTDRSSLLWSVRVCAERERETSPSLLF